MTGTLRIYIHICGEINFHLNIPLVWTRIFNYTSTKITFTIVRRRYWYIPDKTMNMQTDQCFHFYQMYISIIIPRHTILVGDYGLMFVSVHLTIHPSVCHMSVCILVSRQNLSKCQWIVAKLGLALILWRSGLGLLIGKFWHFF